MRNITAKELFQLIFVQYQTDLVELLRGTNLIDALDKFKNNNDITELSDLAAALGCYSNASEVIVHNDSNEDAYVSVKY